MVLSNRGFELGDELAVADVDRFHDRFWRGTLSFIYMLYFQAYLKNKRQIKMQTTQCVHGTRSINP